MLSLLQTAKRILKQQNIPVAFGVIMYSGSLFLLKISLIRNVIKASSAKAYREHLTGYKLLSITGKSKKGISNIHLVQLLKCKKFSLIVLIIKDTKNEISNICTIMTPVGNGRIIRLAIYNTEVSQC